MAKKFNKQNINYASQQKLVSMVYEILTSNLMKDMNLQLN